METNFYLEVAKEYLDMVFERDSRGLYYEHGGPLVDGYIDYDDESYLIDFGASKVVLIPEDESKDWVIKIPIKGIVEFECEFDSGDDECPYDGCSCCEHEESSRYYVEFEGANCFLTDNYITIPEKLDEYYWDYCAVEEEIYKLAEHKKVEEFFIKTERVGEYKGYPIYVQRKVTFNTRGFIVSQDSKDFVTNSCAPVSRMTNSRAFNEMVVEYYGKERAMKLFNFIEEYQIDDLHSNNLGYISNKPVLFDYGGFHN